MSVIIKKRVKEFIIIFVAGILIIGICLGLFFYKKYVQRESNLVLLKNPDKSHEIYILGTIHEYHFYKVMGYSYLDIQNAIDTINPDLLLLEVEQEALDEYGVIKSPVEMIPLWCYAVEQGIDVRGVDWFQVTENSRSWTTDKTRDDNIYENTLNMIGEAQTVLIILGAAHRIEQTERFVKAGYSQVAIDDIDMIFSGVDISSFQYPAQTKIELQKQIEYWQTIAVQEIVEITEADSQGRKYWVKHYNALASSLQKIMDEIIIPNKLTY